MSPCPHASERAPLLRAVFAMEASPGEHDRLMELVRTCDSCRAAWERMSALERLVDGGEGMSQAASDRVLGRVLAAVPDLKEKRPVGRRAALVVAPLLAVAAAVVLMVRPPPRGTYIARGAASAAPGFAVRVFCVPKDGAPQPLAAQGRCSKAAELALAVSSASAGRVRVEATDGAGKSLPGSGDVEVQAGADAVLPLSVPLSEANGPKVHLRVCHGIGECRQQEVEVE